LHRIAGFGVAAHACGTVVKGEAAESRGFLCAGWLPGLRSCAR